MDADPVSLAVPARSDVSGCAALGLLEQLATQTAIAKERIAAMLGLKRADTLVNLHRMGIAVASS